MLTHLRWAVLLQLAPEPLVAVHRLLAGPLLWLVLAEEHRVLPYPLRQLAALLLRRLLLATLGGALQTDVARHPAQRVLLLLAVATPLLLAGLVEVDRLEDEDHVAPVPVTLVLTLRLLADVLLLARFRLPVVNLTHRVFPAAVRSGGVTRCLLGLLPPQRVGWPPQPPEESLSHGLVARGALPLAPPLPLLLPLL